MQATVRYTRTGGTERTTPQAYGLHAEVVASVDMPKELFVFKVSAPSNTDPEAGEVESYFDRVASPVDISEYPVGVSDPENGMPYYRAAEVYIVERSSEAREDTCDLVKRDINELIATLKALESEGVTEEVIHG